MSNKKYRWYKLDNAGKLYPPIMSSRVTTLFRLSATLNDDVDENILQKALNTVIVRFPYFQVNLHSGIFWYYFVHTKKMPKVEKEINYPCMNFEYKLKGKFLFRVLYFKKRISVEFSHALTDGTGAMVFLKSLLVEYFKLLGIEVSATEGIIRPDDKISNEEYEDSFKKYYSKKIPRPPSKNVALKLKFPFNSKGAYNIVTGIMSIKEVKGIAKEYGASVTEFLLAVYFDSLLQLIKENPDKYKRLKPIIVNVPVNLRSILPSITLRNFFISVTPHIDPRLGDYTFKEILSYVHHYFRTEINGKTVSMYISKNVKSELSIFIRLFPLMLKNMILPLIYNTFVESKYTSGFSNMGLMRLPKEIEDLIDCFEVYPPPSKGNIIKVALMSYKDKIYITFGKLTDATDLERIYFRKLRELGIRIMIETN